MCYLKASVAAGYCCACCIKASVRSCWLFLCSLKFLCSSAADVLSCWLDYNNEVIPLHSPLLLWSAAVHTKFAMAGAVASPSCSNCINFGMDFCWSSSVHTHLCTCLPAAGAGEGDLAHLKIHCHRAAVETVLRKVLICSCTIKLIILYSMQLLINYFVVYWQNGMRRAQVRISKRVSKLPFQE